MAKQSSLHLPSANAFMAFGLLVFLASVSYVVVQLQSVITHTEIRKEARESLLRAEVVLSLLKDVETGQRGYVITGLPFYLEPYDAARARLTARFAELRQGLRPYPASRSILGSLDTLIARRLELSAQTIATRQKQGLEAARQFILTNQGKQVMDSIRARFASLVSLMRAEINQQDQQVAEARRLSNRVAWLAAFLGAALMAGASASLMLERRRRREAEQALYEINASLEETVAARTAALRLAKAELVQFARNQDRNIERERRRLAREVHDQLGQVFTALKINLHHLTPQLVSKDEEARCAALLDQGIAISRRIAADLRPPMLDDLGLEPALQHYCKGVAQGLACQVILREAEQLTPAQANQLFRICQEAVTNVLRHAQASHIVIEGHRHEGHYLLRIDDDGRGFNPQDIRADAMGVLGMRERTQLSGGEFSLTPLPPGGTRVEIRLPLAEQAASGDLP